MRLTVTKVVFELQGNLISPFLHFRLTVTKVVFELEKKAKIDGRSVKINSNKSCF